MGPVRRRCRYRRADRHSFMMIWKTGWIELVPGRCALVTELIRVDWRHSLCLCSPAHTNTYPLGICIFRHNAAFHFSNGFCLAWVGALEGKGLG